jgi:hypothetical protein
VTPRTPIFDFGDSSMKGLKVNVRVKGIAKSCRGFDGVIVEVIQLEGYKNYKVKWSCGKIEVYHSRALAIWTPPPPAIANLEAERNIHALPAANLGQINHEQQDGNHSGYGSDNSESYSNYGSR